MIALVQKMKGGKIMKHAGKMIFVVLLIVSLLSACSSSSSSVSKSSSQPVTINFWYLWSGPEAKALESVISDFNKSQNKIIVKGLSVPDQQKQIAAMSSGSGAFDISDTFNSDVASYAAKGVIAPLDQFMKQSNYDTSDFVPSALNASKYNNQTYALPTGVHTQLLLYNKDMFKKAGIANPPATTDELLQDIQKLTVEKNGSLQQLGLDTYDFTTMAYVFGGHWIDSNGKPTPTDPGVLKSYHFFIDNVVKKYGANEIQKFESGLGQYASPQNPFYAGKVAMTIDGEWQAQFIKEYAPNLQWGAVPLPYPPGQSQLANTTQIASGDFFIPSNSKHKQEAWEFLSYLESPKEMEKFTHAIANLPARKSLINSTDYKDLGIQPWIDSLKSNNLHVMPSEPWMAQYTNDLATETSNIKLLKETPEQGMKNVAQKAASYAK